MIYPDFDEFAALSRGAKLVPVALEMAGDLETPISLFMKLGQGKNSYILESVEGGQRWARYSYIGRNPFLIVTAKGNTVSVTDPSVSITTHISGDALEIIEDLMGRYKIAQAENARLCGRRCRLFRV